MVVEDEFIIAMDIENMLVRNGWRVLGPAPTVTAALRLLEDQTPDAALLDANLRGELVTPVAEALRALRVPFLVSSAYDGAQLEARGLGGLPQLRKPVTEQGLLRALERAVGGEA